MYEMLSNGADHDMPTVEEAERNFKAEEPVAVIWDTADNQRDWCIGFYIQNISDDQIQVDHLKCRREGNNFKEWARPKEMTYRLLTLCK